MKTAGNDSFCFQAHLKQVNKFYNAFLSSSSEFEVITLISYSGIYDELSNTYSVSVLFYKDSTMKTHC
jgi:hypothetical protein